MQVGVDTLSVASLVSEKISLWSIKVENFNRSESAKKIYASRDQCHVHVHQFWWVWSLRFRRWLPFKKGQISLSGHGL